MENKVKMRVWHIPQVGAVEKPFYVYVNSTIEGKKVMDNKTRITGIIFEHGEDDITLWTDFVLKKEDEIAIQKILRKYETEGCSVRGTEDMIWRY